MTENKPQEPKKYADSRPVVKPQKKTMTLTAAHVSLQFDDPVKQQAYDASKIYSRDYAWITGTEAVGPSFQKQLRLAAHNNNYTFTVFKSLWVAINKDLIELGSYRHSAETVLDNNLTKGHGEDPSIVWGQFRNKDLGKVSVLCSHYPRFGQPQANDPGRRANLKYTEELAHAIGDKADEFGVGNSLVFYGGDQNIPDTISDTFFGEGLTSSWDELSKYENTGHGTIDVIASYDKDRRVEAFSSRALDDSELMLFTDHYLVEAGFTIRTLG